MMHVYTGGMKQAKFFKVNYNNIDDNLLEHNNQTPYLKSVLWKYKNQYFFSSFDNICFVLFLHKLIPHFWFSLPLHTCLFCCFPALRGFTGEISWTSPYWFSSEAFLRHVGLEANMFLHNNHLLDSKRWLVCWPVGHIINKAL